MRCLELFSGTGSVGREFSSAGWTVVSVDIEKKFNPTLCMSVLDIPLDFWPPGYFDFVWASPPCTFYSKARTTGPAPDMEAANMLTLHCCNLIKALKPTYWAIENPANSSIWQQPCLASLPYVVASYCHYSDWGYRKNTRIACNVVRWTPRVCKYDCKNLVHGFRRHICTAQRGPSRKGDRSFKQEELYRIPPALIQELLRALEVSENITDPASESTG